MHSPFAYWIVWPLAAAIVLIEACSDPASSEQCGGAEAITLDGGSCLVFLDDGQLDAHRSLIEETVITTVITVRELIPVDRTELRILAGSENAIPEIGIGGRAFDGTRVDMTLDPASPELGASLPTELSSQLAHELHHIARMRTVGYGADLLGALVSEGLADHFSVEVLGTDPPLWSMAITGAELEMWIAEAEAEWFNGNYDHGAWFLGQSSTIPRWAGYSIGYELVRIFRDANPRVLASDLYDEPATSFIEPRSSQRKTTSSIRTNERE